MLPVPCYCLKLIFYRHLFGWLFVSPWIVGQLLRWSPLPPFTLRDRPPPISLPLPPSSTSIMSVSRRVVAQAASKVAKVTAVAAAAAPAVSSSVGRVMRSAVTATVHARAFSQSHTETMRKRAEKRVAQMRGSASRCTTVPRPCAAAGPCDSERSVAASAAGGHVHHRIIASNQTRQACIRTAERGEKSGAHTAV